MIISMTPLRISFLGGGTDYPEHFGRHGGATLCTSINKYTYVTVSPLTDFFDHRIRVSYSKTELCGSVDEIQHPSVRECLRFLGITGGVEIAVVSDLPARTGLGSSSCFTVGLLHALHAFKGQFVSRSQLAAEAVHVERNLIRERVGLQDQYACACGGLARLEFCGENIVSTMPVILPPERSLELQRRLMIFYTGLQRSAHDVLEQQLARTSAGMLQSSLLQMQQAVDRGLKMLTGTGSLDEFGQLLHEGWLLKRGLSSAVSNSCIDDAYRRAREAGAIGGKLLGAGGGGFLLVYADPSVQPSVRSALKDMKEVNIAFENQGSRIIFYQP